MKKEITLVGFKKILHRMTSSQHFSKGEGQEKTIVFIILKVRRSHILMRGFR